MSPALADLPVKKVVRALESVGFQHTRTKGSPMPSTGTETAVARLSRCHGTVKRGTLGSILRQAGLVAGEFLELLD